MSELFPGIKQISQTGNDMYIQGAFPVGIGNTDVAYLADPADTMLLAGRDPVIKEVSVGISGEEAALYDVSGTPPLSLPNSLGKPLKEWEVELVQYQEGSGDPSPDNVRPIHGTDKVTVWTSGSNQLVLSGRTVYSGTDLNPASTWPTDTALIYMGFSASGYCRANNVPTNAEITDTSVKFTVSTNWYGIGFSIPVTPNTSYYLSMQSTNSAQIAFFDSNGTFISNTTQLTFTTPQNASYAIVGFLKSGVGTDYQADYPILSLLQGIDYTAPVAPSQTAITLPTTIYNGSVSDDGVVSNWNEVDLRTISWTSHATLPNVYTGDGRYLPQWKRIYAATVANALCSEYKLTTSAAGGVDAIDFSISLGSGTSMNIYVHNSAVANINEFMTAISGVQLAYELETPTTFAAPSVTIPTPSGNATTWATAEDGVVDSMEVTYIGKA